MNRCERCLFVLPASDFRLRADTGQRRTACKSCEADAAAERRGGRLERQACDTCGVPSPKIRLGGTSGCTCSACVQASDASRLARWEANRKALMAKLQAASPEA